MTQWQVALAGAVGLLGLSGLCLRVVGPPIQTDIAAQIDAMLDEFALTGVESVVSGRSVTLRGVAEDADSYGRLLGRIAAVRGVRRVEDTVTGGAGLAVIADGDYALRMQYDGTRLSLTGHVPSDRARESLLHAARWRFPEATLETDLVKAPAAPAGWAQSAEAALTELATLRHGSASLEDGLVELRGATATSAERERLRVAFASRLPSGTEGRADIAVEPLLAPVATGCQRGFDALLENGTIEFSSNSAAIAAASRELLKSLADVALACGGREFEIRGHTDGKGNSRRNQALSEQRAQAVRAFFIASGVPATALQAVGLGDTQPIADNATAAGRARNRRIEIISQ